ncbi:hypothetical protein ABTH91_21365, partial [Acinetobacter baumannii]
SSQERPFRAGLYALVLAADGKSPLAPRPGDEEARTPGQAEDGKDERKAGDAKPEPVKPVKIDFDGLADRVVALPVGERNYDN